MNEELAVPGSYMINDQNQKVEVIFKEESPEVPKCVINDAEIQMFGKGREVIA